MKHDLSLKARRALEKYGYSNCREAYRLNAVDGQGANSIANTLVSCIKTTRAADAAINAGRELSAADKRALAA